MTPKISVTQRRARLVARHHLGEPAGSVASAVSAMIALHATDPVTVYLSARARTRIAGTAEVDAALYAERAGHPDAGHAADDVRGPGPARRRSCSGPAPTTWPGGCAGTRSGTWKKAGSVTATPPPGCGTWARRRCCGRWPRGGSAFGGGAVGGRAPAADAAGLRAGQVLWRHGEHHQPGADAAVRRGAHGARPPARRLGIGPVRVVPGGRRGCRDRRPMRRRWWRAPADSRACWRGPDRQRRGPSSRGGGCWRSGRRRSPTCSGGRGGPAGRPRPRSPRCRSPRSTWTGGPACCWRR